MSRFSDYLNNLGEPLVTRYELLAATGELLATSTEADVMGDVHFWVSASSPSLSFDRGSRSVRSLSLTMTANNTFPSRALDPVRRNLVRISAGPPGIWWTQATLVVTDADIVTDGAAHSYDLHLRDTTSLLDTELPRTITFAAGDTVESAVRRLLELVLRPNTFDVARTGFTVPEISLAVGDNVAKAISDLLEGCGHELTADVWGKVLSRAIPPSNADATAVNRWTYGSAGLPIQELRRPLRSRNPQGFVITGGVGGAGDATVSRTVVDSDPASLGRFVTAGNRPVTLPSKQYPWIETEAQADAAGYGQLRREGDGPGIVTIQVAPNPAMRSYDVLDIDSQDVDADGPYQVVDYDLPTDTGDGSFMTVTARGLWSPDKNASRPADLDPGFQVSFTDDFDRADEDLKGDDWIEINWSWGVENQLAIQRYWGGYSLALVKQALQHSNHYAMTRLAKIPTGRLVGPLIRSNGGFEGYAAMADDSGNISLESWIGGQLDERLVSYSSGIDLVGREVRVAAIGSDITVELDSTVVISVVDDRHVSATMVGMNALGGPPSNAPSVSYFEAGQET